MRRPSSSTLWVSKRRSAVYALGAQRFLSYASPSRRCRRVAVLTAPRLRAPRIFTLLFSTLIGSTILSGLIITPALLVHFFWYKPHPDDHRRFVKDNVEAWLFWAAANVSISWALALIVDIVPAIIRFVISAAWGHVSEVIKTRLELYASVKGPIKPVLYAASGWVSWVIIFAHIFKLYDMGDEDQSRASYTPRVRIAFHLNL